jgi:polysaccharide deacetylase 2 family uncharacterized protein YibQ
MTKAKGRKKRSKTTWAIYVLVVSLVILFIGVIAISAYKKGYSDARASIESRHMQEQEKQKKLLAQITDIAAPKNDLVGRLQDVLNKEQDKKEISYKKEIDTKHEFDTNTLGRPPKGPKRVVKKPAVYSNFKKPKLAIIIDDVSFAHDVQSIKALKMPLTMSFLPPSPAHPDSAKLASREKLYMVHLPMEAMHFSAEEPITLRVSDTKQIINKRVQQVKELFPRAYYVNNHTGSRFTSDERAVKDLIVALKKEGIGFLDSRTTAETKVPMVMKSLGKPYIARDVFLDHESDVTYIQEQIKKAIKKAKEHGSAIAIGHPRKETLQALKNSKRVLESVELVYINKVI